MIEARHAIAVHLLDADMDVGKLGEGWDANTGLGYPCPNFQPKNIWTKMRTHFGLGSPAFP
jgi:hypothetical protein